VKQEVFQFQMEKAQIMKRLDRPDYWRGYIRGLLRAYNGRKFGTDEEHSKWINLKDDKDDAKAQAGRGYVDALEIK
jgi:hypothetical protein